MKSRKLALAFLSPVVIGLAAAPDPVWAQDAGVAAGPQRSHDEFQRDRLDPGYWSRLGMVRRSSQLIRMPIVDLRKQGIGSIDDFVIDLASGDLVCVLAVASGGSSAGLVPLPARSFGSVARVATFGRDLPGLDGAPRLAMGPLDPQGLEKALADSFTYFGLKSSWEGHAKPRNLWRTGKIMALPVRNQANESLGGVADFMVDVPGGRVFFVVVSLDGGASQVYAVPPTSLKLEMPGASLLLDGDRTKIAQTSNSSGFFWTDLIDPAWAAAAYKTFGLEMGAATPGRENVRMKVEGSGDAAGSAKVQTDLQLSRRVSAAFLGSDLKSSAYQGVQILALKGKVQLTGRVKNEKLKLAIGALAEKAAGPGQVDNQLEVHR